MEKVNIQQSLEYQQIEPEPIATNAPQPRRRLKRKKQKTKECFFNSEPHEDPQQSIFNDSLSKNNNQNDELVSQKSQFCANGSQTELATPQQEIISFIFFGLTHQT